MTAINEYAPASRKFFILRRVTNGRIHTIGIRLVYRFESDCLPCQRYKPSPWIDPHGDKLPFFVKYLNPIVALLSHINIVIFINR